LDRCPVNRVVALGTTRRTVMDATQPSNPWPLAGGLTAAALATILGGIVYIAIAIQPEPVTAPKSFSPYTAADKTFQCVRPDGWRADGGAQGGVICRASFEQGLAEIEIISDLAGSLMGDIVKGPGGAMPDLGGVPGAPDIGGGSQEKPRSPVEKVHDMSKKDAESALKKDGFGEYEEQGAQAFQSALGEARFSEFGAGGIFGKARGFRVTILGGERRITVLCRAPEKDWEKVKPAFRQVINSLTPGTG
jgi:hypothetical protein